MKKILYFSHGLSANGIETFLVNVLGKLNLKKYDVTVLIAIDEGVPSLHEQTVRDLGIRIINAGDMDSIGKKIAYIKNVKKELECGDYDIVHSNMDLLNGITLFLAKKAGVKKRICHAHNSKSQYLPTGRFAGLKKIIQKLYVKIMKSSILHSSTDLVSCSELASEYFYGKRSSTLIYNGVNLDRFVMPGSFNSAEYAKQLGAEEEKKIVSVGRLSTQKNPSFALDVISELKKIRSDFQYIWVGTGELEDEIKNKAKNLGLEDTVIFTGVRTDVPQILNCCDCFFMPSLFEGLPFSLVEAQAAGLKCLVSDVVSPTADVGLIDFYSLEKSAKDWAEKMSALLDSAEMKADSEKIRKFDINYTVEQLEEIYDK
ncbi:MAG: glycosyltransferase [Clostridia bacterium]|nr:glycosyltransferase [Clostridia bacterium]